MVDLYMSTEFLADNANQTISKPESVNLKSYIQKESGKPSVFAKFHGMNNIMCIEMADKINNKRYLPECTPNKH